MKLPIELILLSLTHLASSAALQPRGAAFPSLRGLTSLSTDNSNPDVAKRSEKFFHEATFDSHYDGRFAEAKLLDHTRAFHLRLLLKSYTDTSYRIGIRTWIMHGCLLGWWWNSKIMPWDSDVDFMVDERSMQELGNWWNMTVHHYTAKDLGISDPASEFTISDSGESEIRIPNSAEEAKAHFHTQALEEEVLRNGKKYLLEVNPHYTNSSTKDHYNVIDARWIDTATGLYIDITTVHTAPTPADRNNPPSPSSSSTTNPDSDVDADIAMYVKDKHLYTSSQLFPLREATFESTPVRIPYAYEDLLREEYGPDALTDTWFKGYGFDAETQEWVERDPTPEQAKEMVDRDKEAQKSGKKKKKKGWRGKGGKPTHRAPKSSVAAGGRKAGNGTVKGE